MAPASTIPKDPQNSARATGRRTPLQGIILTHNALTRGTPSPQHAGWLPRPVQHAPRASDPAARHHHRPGDLTARRHHRPGDRTPVAWRARMGSCTRLRPSSGTLHDISQRERRPVVFPAYVFSWPLRLAPPVRRLLNAELLVHLRAPPLRHGGAATRLLRAHHQLRERLIRDKADAVE